MLFENHSAQIHKYIGVLNGLSGLTPPLDFKAQLSAKYLKVIVDDTEKYDKLASLNIDWLHNEIVSLIMDKKTDHKSIDDLFAYLSRIAREVTLKLAYVPKPPESDLLDYFEFGKPELTKEEKENSDFIWARLPKYVAMQYLGEIKTVKNDVTEKIESWNSEISTWENKVNAHEENLKKFHQKYNFVGLSKAFNEMFSNKETERNNTFKTLIVLGCVLLLPLILQFTSSEQTAFARVVSGDWSASTTAKLFSLIGFELVILYFFKITLDSYYSVKAQLLQLDLRQSLCAFIENYAEFSKDLNAGKEKAILEKFEALIFSGIAPTSNKIPNTFDGLEQLGALIKEVRGN